jgi:hypothetical protein
LKYIDGAAKQLAERRNVEAALAAAGGDANIIALGSRPEVSKLAVEPLHYLRVMGCAHFCRAQSIPSRA